MKLHEYEGDLLTANVNMIAHQCNCVLPSDAVAGLARAVFQRFPRAGAVAHARNDVRNYGIAEVIDVEPAKWVANIYGQLLPGRPSWGIDDEFNRKLMFVKALNSLADWITGSQHTIINVTSIGFPKLIGCGLAGGDWTFYRGAIIQCFESVEGDLHIIEKK